MEIWSSGDPNLRWVESVRIKQSLCLNQRWRILGIAGSRSSLSLFWSLSKEEIAAISRVIWAELSTRPQLFPLVKYLEEKKQNRRSSFSFGWIYFKGSLIIALLNKTRKYSQYMHTYAGRMKGQYVHTCCVSCCVYSERMSWGYLPRRKKAHVWMGLRLV